MVTFKKKGVGREGMKKNILKKYFIFSNSKKKKNNNFKNNNFIKLSGSSHKSNKYIKDI